jgi:hypothetical protein
MEDLKGVKGWVWTEIWLKDEKCEISYVWPDLGILTLTYGIKTQKILQ